MPEGNIDRRVFLGGTGTFALFAASGLADAGRGVVRAEPGLEPEKPFAFEAVKKLAEELAQTEHAAPAIAVEEPFDKLSAEQYHDIKFRAEHSIGKGENVDCEIQLLPMGWIYDSPVEISLIEGGKPRALTADGKLFAFGPLIEKAPEQAPYGFSGFRLLGPINRAEVFDEFATFQGASYFRAMGRGQALGLSARGLAVDTAQPSGEEFPVFRAFYIEKPKPNARAIQVYALLDSKSVTGAYRFSIVPGESTVIDVLATLYPRRELTHVGLAPLTSMFLLGSASRRIAGDIRPSVHNSEGLAILNGKGERLWRPLSNPAKLQTSAFVDEHPRGFGLCQRERDFAQFDDLNAHFERRPSAWVEPIGMWGQGYVELIEIPAEEQIHDNIVVYWKPAKPLAAGEGHTITYKLHWGQDVPVAWAGARVRRTNIGQARRDNNEIKLFVVDFEGPALKDIEELPQAELSISAGSSSHIRVERHPSIEGVRISFELDTAGLETIEMRLGLKAQSQLISESWLFRWTRS
jgi:glucans biosynthesis protein